MSEIPKIPDGTEKNVVRFAVPKGDDELLVGIGTDKEPGQTAEDQLRNIGKQSLGHALSPKFGWHTDGQSNYITDSLDSSGHRHNALARHLYEQRWIPGLDGDETDFIIYDLDKPAVKVVRVTVPVDPE